MHVNDILLRPDVQAIAERLYRQVDWSGGPLSCWPFLGRLRKGYGQLALGSRKDRVLTHRLSYALAHGALPDLPDGSPAQVLHHCDNPPCCNPAHLFLGSNRDNIDDMLAKNRQAKGEAAGRAKLTEPEVRAILDSFETADVLAARFGVATGTISNIRQRKSWRHLTGVPGVAEHLNRGENSYTAKLTEADVRAILVDTRSHRLIGLTYGVTRRHIGRIKQGHHWKHLD